MKAGDQKKVQDDDRVPQDDADHSQDEKDSNKLEDVRQSNFAYSQTKVAEFISAFFAMLGVGCAIVACEAANGFNENGQNDDWIWILQIICNVSTIPLLINIVFSKILYIRWMKFRIIFTDLDNVFNTGQFKWIVIEFMLMLVMPYPPLQNMLYVETSNDFSEGISFQWNDFLLSFMLYFRLIYLVKALLNMSFYTDPRSQRVCVIYGKDADYTFAIKSIMKQDSWMVLSLSLVITLLSMSYQVRIFERHVTPAYEYVTTSMWVFMITMLTIGYGDSFPKSHMGRMMGIVAAGWGVFYVSLFVIALNNMLEFNNSELKAFNLMQRLAYKDQLREEAAGALAATYKLKLERKKPIIDKKKEIQQLRMYRTHMNYFQKISKQIRNISDPEADMEQVKSQVKMIVDDVDIVKMAQFFIYLDSRKLNRKMGQKQLRRKKTDKNE